jgi:hypothetical protein
MKLRRRAERTAFIGLLKMAGKWIGGKQRLQRKGIHAGETAYLGLSLPDSLSGHFSNRKNVPCKYAQVRIKSTKK